MKLTPPQSELVSCNTGHHIAIAGPGSGKTFTVVEKIHTLIRDKFIEYPRSILAITFTRNAAKELRRRISNKGLSTTGVVFVTNFHGFGLNVLKNYGSLIDINCDFEVLNPRLQMDIIEKLAGGNPWPLSNWIEDKKRRLIYPGSTEFDLLPADRFKDLYGQYQSFLKKHNLLDNNDLICLTFKLFEQSDFARNVYATKYPYVIVDEFQDTDSLQLKIVLHLAKHKQNVGSTIVADDDQSLYRFRGAQPENIQKFAHETGAKFHVMDANFRCPKKIVHAASVLISGATDRYPKVIQASSNKEGKLYFLRYANYANEAEQIANHVSNLISVNGIPAGEIALIARSKNRLSALPEALTKKGIPFFYRDDLRHEVDWETDAAVLLSHFKLFKTNKGLAQGKLAKIIEDYSLHLYFDDLAPLTIAKGLIDLSEACAPIVESEIGLKDFFDNSGLSQILLQCCSNKRELAQRKRNLSQLIKDFLFFEPDASTSPFKSLLTRLVDSNSVQIMTGHGAKGLEFEWVFVIGLEENSLPSFFAIRDGSEQAINDELRIFYVSLTRSKLAAVITYSEKDSRGYLTKESRFISSIPGNLFDSVL